MDDGQDNHASLGQGTAVLSQTAYAVSAAAKGGMSAAGTAVGTAFSGPLGVAVEFIVSRKTFWKMIAGILAFLFLWMFIIANLIGIVLSYLGFADADSFASTAQSAELSNLQVRIGQIFSDQERKNEIDALIEAARDLQIQEISKDKEEKYAGCEVQVTDEYETKLKGNLSLYLSVFLAENWDQSAIQSFLGYPDGLGLDISTNLSSPYDTYFREAAQTYHVPAALLMAMGKVESGFDPHAKSNAGAMGIMQLMPATAASLGVSDPYDPRQNIMGGAKYIASNIKRFKKYPDCLELALAAYNAGPGTVIKNNYQVPPKIRGYVDKVLGYVDIQKKQVGEGKNEDLSAAFSQLKETVEGNAGHFFAWSYTGEKEIETEETAYFLTSEETRTEISQADYEQLLQEGGAVTTEKRLVKKKTAEYTIALMLHTQLAGAGSGYEYKYVTDQRTFELIVKVLQLMQEGIDTVKNGFFSLFSWTDFVTGGQNEESYTEDMDVSGDIITYDTVGNGVKQVVYYNQGEEPWKSMSYGSSTIGRSGCGPTSLAIVISTLTGQTVTPQMTCAYSIKNGEYKSGVGTSHSFPANAANHWGLTCKRVGKNKMADIVQALKDGKMVVVICAPYTITKSGSGHYIVLTGVTRDGYITIADCGSRQRTGKVYSVETIKSYGRNLEDGAFWIIGT